MLARVAGDFYWMGRYLERAEQTARLLEYQLTRLVDSPAEDLAAGWAAVYRALRQPPLEAANEAVDAERFLMADAYTLAGSLVEESANPHAVLSCWAAARENAKQVRPHLPLRVWTCLNQGFLWLRGNEFAEWWTRSPSALVAEVVDRLCLFFGVVEARMPRDDAWRFLELGRFVERVQHQTCLLDTWNGFGRRPPAGRRLPWSDLLRVCGAYELYCRNHSMAVERETVLDLLIRSPELPRSLRFAVQRIGEMLSDIDPGGGRYPMAPAHQTALRLAAAVEVEKARRAGEPGGSDFFPSLQRDGRKLHDLIMSTYMDYPAAGEALA